jgi:hypothetical protein
MRRVAGFGWAVVLAVGLAGCLQPPGDGEKLMWAAAGKHRAGLSAEFSNKTGNELIVVFETADPDRAAAPLPLTGFTATAKASDGGEQVLEFKPAPKDDRPGDPAGKCSRFVASAGWMKPDDTLTITATVEIDGKKERIVWSEFHPKKYGHVEE